MKPSRDTNSYKESEESASFPRWLYAVGECHRTLHRLQPEETVGGHLQQQPTMGESVNVRRAVGSILIADWHLQELQVQLRFLHLRVAGLGLHRVQRLLRGAAEGAEFRDHQQ